MTAVPIFISRMLKKKKKQTDVQTSTQMYTKTANMTPIKQVDCCSLTGKKKNKSPFIDSYCFLIVSDVCKSVCIQEIYNSSNNTNSTKMHAVIYNGQLTLNKFIIMGNLGCISKQKHHYFQTGCSLQAKNAPVCMNVAKALWWVNTVLWGGSGSRNRAKPKVSQ